MHLIIEILLKNKLDWGMVVICGEICSSHKSQPSTSSIELHLALVVMHISEVWSAKEEVPILLVKVDAGWDQYPFAQQVGLPTFLLLCPNPNLSVGGIPLQ